jgi:hypothetical protein
MADRQRRADAARAGVREQRPGHALSHAAGLDARAQFIRLAWSIQAGTPIERPSIVAERCGR